jgi:hypothetical protein
MTENLPADNSGEKRSDESGRGNNGRFFAIGQFHYHANDLSELRKLAEVDAVLAEKVVEQRDRESARLTASYNFGLLCAIVLLALILVCFTCMLVFAGLLATATVVVLILAVSLLVRVILTGEWSDTSWFGKMVNLLVKSLGGSPDPD